MREKFGELPIYKFQLGLAYFYLTRFPFAVQEFESLAREQPKSSRVQYFLGGSYQVMGELGKAEGCYGMAITLKPDEASYSTALASLLKKSEPDRSYGTRPLDREGVGSKS